MPYIRKGVLYEGPTLKRGRKPKSKVLVVKSASTARVSKPLKRAINKAIANNIETKCQVRQIWQQNLVQGTGLDASSGLGLVTSGLSGTPNSIVPLVAQGDGDADRSGSVIRGKRLALKIILRALDTTGQTSGTNPFKGKPFLARVIVYNHRYALDDYGTAGIIDKGNTVGNLDSLPDSWLEPYDKKEFKILFSRQFKMCPFADKDGTNPITVDNMPNGFSNVRVIRKMLKVPKRLLYTTTGNLPNNYQPKLAIAICNLDGTGASTTQFRLQVSCETQLYYTDA